MLATSIQWVLVTNAFFHLGTTFLFREYSPGLVTAVTLFPAATAYVFVRTFREELLTPPQVAFSVALGTAVGVAAVASLWLHMDFDWRLRRSQQEGTRRLV